MDRIIPNNPKQWIGLSQIIQKQNMMKSSNENSREMSLGLVPLDCDCQGLSVRGQTTPSERDLRAQRRNSLRSVHESVVSSNDKKAKNLSAAIPSLRKGINTTRIGVKFKAEHTQNRSMTNTLEEKENQSYNLHSSMQSNALKSLSDDNDVISSNPGPLNHKTRYTNLTDFETNHTEKINFPKSGDITGWKELDKELESALPIMFDENFFNYSTSVMSKKFDKFLVAFFTEHCGLVPGGGVKSKSAGSSSSKKTYRHRGLERLRRKKNDLRRA